VRCDDHIPIDRAETGLFETAVETFEPTRFRIAVTDSVQKYNLHNHVPLEGRTLVSPKPLLLFATKIRKR